MPRIVRKLTVLEVAAAAKEPGLHAVGDNLYLQVKNGSASWAYRFMIAGKARCMGLGSFRKTNLAKARQRAQECHDLLAAGKDPIDARHAVRTATAVAAAQAISFEQCADEYIKAKHTGWGAKHAAQWKKTLETFTFPIIGKLPVKDIDTVLVVKVLEPIWQTKTETAKRLRSRIESVLDWAKARGHRAGENPARWRGHLETQLVKPGDIKIEQHHAAMPYAAVPAFVATVRSQEGTAARALEFAILTAARSGEIFGATWREIDQDAKAWTIPASRMKAGLEHRVPLSDRAVEILKAIRPENVAAGDLVFPGGKPGSKLGNNAMLRVMRRLDCTLTAHGFRSAFSTWAAEQSNAKHDVTEAALAHITGSKTVKAYRHTDYFERRVPLMDQWAQFCTTAPAGDNVVPLHRVG